MTDSGDGVIESERRQRVHGPASLGLVPEDVPARRTHREASLLRRGWSRDSSLGTKERGPEECSVCAGVVLPAVGLRVRRRRDVEQREVGAGSARNESVGVDGSRRRLRVVGVDHAVDLPRWG